ncbi:hypothetical protein EC09E025_05171 [Escherichia coli O145:H28]|nr:hypothetical protein ECEH2011_00894 [Escherichia coli O145:H28]GEG24916.1 hypothetical protein ECEH2085_00418 [Escherichia coli O145:H28]GEG51092.1 hypothetical protein ECEH2086_02109 [Escherichia coli O145:H28]GEH59349.1 hypothetical protein EC09E025_05171 [Escherichia coli O145:H28]GEH60378.1 hypothetical protein EC16002_04263 [Escherichia coli O145:H28]
MTDFRGKTSIFSHPVYLFLRKFSLQDSRGGSLVTRKMETEAFGDSNATRTTDAFLETECVENVATTEIIKATEESNGHRVSLPLSVFNPQDYHPLLITVSGKNVN